MKTVFVTLLIVAFVAVKALPVEEVAVKENFLVDEVETKLEDQVNIASGLIREKRQFGKKCKSFQAKLVDHILII